MQYVLSGALQLLKVRTFGCYDRETGTLDVINGPTNVQNLLTCLWLATEALVAPKWLQAGRINDVAVAMIRHDAEGEEHANALERTRGFQLKKWSKRPKLPC